MNGQVLLHRRGPYTRGRAIYDFAKISPNGMKLKEFGPRGRVLHTP